MTEQRPEFRFLWQAMGPYRRGAFGIMALALLDTVLASLGIGMVLPVFQSLLEPRHENRLLSSIVPALAGLEPGTRLTLIAGATVCLFGAKACVSLVMAVASNNFLQKVRAYWVTRIGENYLFGPHARMAARKQGELLNDWFNETLAAGRFYQSYLGYLTSGILTLTLVVLGFFVNWQAMLALMVLGLLLILLVRGRIYGGAARLSRLKIRLNQAITSAMVENIANARDLRLMSAETPRLALLDGLYRDLRSVFVRGAVLAELPRLSGEFLTVFALMSFVVVGVVVLGASPPAMLPMLAFFFIAFYRMISAGSVAMSARVKALNEFHSVVAVDALVRQAGGREDREAGLPMEQIETDIRFHDVTFDYGTGHPVLADVEVVIPRGKTTFLVGPSGSGKSTLLDLLMRLAEPSAGSIQVNGRAAADYRLSDWRRSFGYVSQEATLFNGSIRMNLLLARPSATDAEIQEACRLAGADEFIQALPDGFDASIGDRGYNLSGGQRKRIAIARAVINRPAVLILDEATTSFEQSLEREMLKGLRSALPGLTVIQVTHRLQTASEADWVIAMEAGRVAASGTWPDMEKRIGPFSGTPVEKNCD